MAQPAALRIGYLVHNLNDAAVERRCRMFALGGASMRVAGFCRDETVCDALVARGAMSLGQSRDAALVARATATLQEAILHQRLKAFFRDCDVIVARNLEQLGIARAIVGERPLVYECLDIHRSLVGQGMGSRLVRSVEGALLPRCDLLITSSPAFLRNHFDHRPLKAPALLVENKLLPDGGEAPRSAARGVPAPPYVVSWFGMLRCKRTLAFLQQLVRRGEGRIAVLIAGKPSPAEFPDFEGEVAATPGMTYVGPYSYADLPELYGRCDFAWSIDWFEEGLNSKWLLPNRLYEAIAFGAIPIALGDVEVGHWLERHGASLIVADGEMAAQRLLDLEPAELGALREGIARIDRGDVICDEAECRELVRTITSLSAR
ncbi:glycosyltransferase family 4 protein [Aurantiacibacter suaedae]|uniref:glycosyltransferase family 4 protein n=1 Tax=Aurantiacibacter suaedae TaxID=2545755 RepID=UPI0010F8353D|nr:glycosyltransferase family 4 protein [Aurantiacibacter suaedae]